MTPVSFEGCAGWLHRESGSTRGVVICPAGEYETTAVHQAFRVLADRLAAAGLPTLRFDYPGTGDSLEIVGERQGAGPRIAAIRAAIRFLVEHAGVEEVALVGWRLGAAWALAALDGSAPIERCAFIRPTIRGKIYIAEQRALDRVLANRHGPGVNFETPPGVIEIEGFQLTPPEIDEIASIDLMSATGPLPRRVLLVGEPGAQRYQTFQAWFAERGVHCEQADLSQVEGWAPHAIPQPPPLADMEKIAQWLAEGAQPGPALPVAASGLRTEDFTETVLSFGPNGELVGVLCEPAGAKKEVSRAATIFLNTGANPHTGPGRATVEQCRALARLGIATFRIDLLGLGDSAWRPEGPLESIHRLERAADVSAAIDALSHQGFSRFRLVGVCSGGFLAVHAAARDERVSIVVIVNPQFLSPLSEKELADPAQGTFASTSVYLHKLVSADLWTRALTGRLPLRSVAAVPREILARKTKAIRAYLQRRRSRSPCPSPTDESFAAVLRILKQRNCKVHLLMSETDASREVFATETNGMAPESLRGSIEVRVLEGADHTLVTPFGRALFLAALPDLLEQRGRRPEPETKIA